MPITQTFVYPLSDPSSANFSALSRSLSTAIQSSAGFQRGRGSRVLDGPAHPHGHEARFYIDLDDDQASARDVEFSPAKTAAAAAAAEVELSGNPRAALVDWQWGRGPVGIRALDDAAAAKKTARGEEGPVSEVLYQYFAPAGKGDATTLAEERVATIKKFLDEAGATAEGLTGETAVGWARGGHEFKGEQGCALLVVIIGWESVEAHARYRETEAFKGLIPMLRGMEGLRGMELVHVACSEQF